MGRRLDDSGCLWCLPAIVNLQNGHICGLLMYLAVARAQAGPCFCGFLFLCNNRGCWSHGLEELGRCSQLIVQELLRCSSGESAHYCIFAAEFRAVGFLMFGRCSDGRALFISWF
jgi:hypothetical protein